MDDVAGRLEREREFHNKTFDEGSRAALYERYYSIARSSKDAYRRFLDANCPGKRALEYGCGPGSVVFDMLAAGAATISAIDISDVAIEQARERAARRGARIDLRVMNAEALAYPDSSFDVITGLGILHHLDLGKALSELARTLAPDGKAIFLEPLGHNPAINLYRRLTPAMRTVDEHPLLRSDLERAALFFGKVDVRYFHLTSLLAVPFRRTRAFPRIVAALEAFDRFLFRWVPPLRWQAWACVITLSAPVKAHAKPDEPRAAAAPAALAA